MTFYPTPKELSNYSHSAIYRPVTREMLFAAIVSFRSRGYKNADIKGMIGNMIWVGTYPAFGSARSKHFWAKVDAMRATATN
jgi:hypothetical protein